MKKNDSTFNNDDLRRPKVGFIFIPEENFLKEGNNQICFCFGGHDALNCKCLKKTDLTITSAINFILFFTILGVVAIYNWFTSLVKQSFKQYLSLSRRQRT